MNLYKFLSLKKILTIKIIIMLILKKKKTKTKTLMYGKMEYNINANYVINLWANANNVLIVPIVRNANHLSS